MVVEDSTEKGGIIRNFCIESLFQGKNEVLVVVGGGGSSSHAMYI